MFYPLFFFLMIRRPPRSTLSSSSAASDVYKRQVLPPRHRVGVVLHDGWQADPHFDLGLQRLVPPGQVRGEAHGPTTGLDEAGGADPHRRHRMGGPQRVHHLGDGVGRPVNRGARGAPLELGQDATVLVDDPGRDLGAADVHADGECHAAPHSMCSGSMTGWGGCPGCWSYAATVSLRARYVTVMCSTGAAGRLAHSRSCRSIMLRAAVSNAVPASSRPSTVSGLTPRASASSWHTGQRRHSALASAPAPNKCPSGPATDSSPVSYTHLRAHE